MFLHLCFFSVFHRANGNLIAKSTRKSASIKMSCPGMWSRSRRFGLETVSRRTNVSSRSRLDLGPMRLGSRLGLGSKGLMHIPSHTVMRLSPLCFKYLAISRVGSFEYIHIA